MVPVFNVYPQQLKMSSCSITLQEVAAVGVPLRSSGEAVKIFVVKKDPSLTEESLVTLPYRSRSSTKAGGVSKRELPKSNVGKFATST